MGTTAPYSASLTFHHVGLLVDDINASIEHYAALVGRENISAPVLVASQKVKVCFVRTGSESFIELVEPTEEGSIVSKLLKKRVSYYHVAYKVQNIHAEIERLEKLHYKAMELFHSEAFGNKLCVFLFTPEAHLIELIEA